MKKLPQLLVQKYSFLLSWIKCALDLLMLIYLILIQAGPEINIRKTVTLISEATFCYFLECLRLQFKKSPCTRRSYSYNYFQYYVFISVLAIYIIFQRNIVIQNQTVFTKHMCIFFFKICIHRQKSSSLRRRARREGEGVFRRHFFNLCN